jgi:hypothetical protein
VKEPRRTVKLDDADQRREVMKHHTAAEKFWTEPVERANAQ